MIEEKMEDRIGQRRRNGVMEGGSGRNIIDFYEGNTLDGASRLPFMSQSPL